MHTMLRNITKKVVGALCVMSLMLSSFLLTGCGDDAGESVIPADYGTYGADFARQLATEFPYRKAYTEDEAGAGMMIEDELKNLGYDVSSQEFTGSNGGTSCNYIIKIDGDGFMAPDNGGEYHSIRRSIVIGAHYDSSFSKDEVPEGYTYDGISDNASGIGCLMAIAKEIKEYDLGFDVYIVAFGAGNDSQAGSNFFYASLDEEQRHSIEAMYCIDSIYAGDKIYASSGLNSLITSQKYDMRRKLYQAYDVAYDNMLSSINGFNLLYNESGISIDLNGDGTNDIYREVTLNKSDYVVFDNANIPIVYFDGFDYNFDNVDETKETKNLNLQEFGGIIRGTLIDSSSLLDPILDTQKDGDRLEIRINNIAFIILESMKKGSDDGMTNEEYNDYLADIELSNTDEENVSNTTTA